MGIPLDQQAINKRLGL